MKKEEIVAVAFRITAIFLFVDVLRYLGRHALFIYNNEDWLLIFVTSIIMLVIILIPVFLWRKSLAIAKRLLPDQDNELVAEKIDLESVKNVSFIILGLYVLTNAVPDAFYWLVAWYKISRFEDGPVSIDPEQWAAIYTTGLELIIGIWLLFGASGLRGLFKLARTAGSTQ